MATQGSYAFRDNGKGMVWDSHLRADEGDTHEPNPDERERAMGNAFGTTASPNVNSRERHVILGGDSTPTPSAPSSVYAVPLPTPPLHHDHPQPSPLRHNQSFFFPVRKYLQSSD
jgi:hypothetical protein